MAHLCNAALDRAPATQAAPHHHHRCHRRRDRKQKSLEKGPSLSADTDGGACEGALEGWWLQLGSKNPCEIFFPFVTHDPTGNPGCGDRTTSHLSLGTLLALRNQAWVRSVFPQPQPLG